MIVGFLIKVLGNDNVSWLLRFGMQEKEVLVWKEDEEIGFGYLGFEMFIEY